MKNDSILDVILVTFWWPFSDPAQKWFREPFWSPFWHPFGLPLAPFGFPLAPFGSLLPHFGLPLASLWLPLALFWLPFGSPLLTLELHFLTFGLSGVVFLSLSYTFDENLIKYNVLWSFFKKINIFTYFGASHANCTGRGRLSRTRRRSGRAPRGGRRAVLKETVNGPLINTLQDCCVTCSFTIGYRRARRPTFGGSQGTLFCIIFCIDFWMDF